MQEQNNPLMCDPESGVCEIPANKTNLADSSLVAANKKPIKIIYYTDPICSSCWGNRATITKTKIRIRQFY